MEIKGTRTEQNLLKSFAGESQAKNRYTFFAKVARKEQLVEIEQWFLEVARNEEQHAKEFFKHLEGGMVEITATYPAGVIGTTLENLKAAATGEHEEYELLYPEFAKVAYEEGFNKIGKLFELIAEVEKEHEAKFIEYANLLEQDKYFNEGKENRWVCYKCGYVHKAEQVINKCPICDHQKGYFIR